MKPVDIPTIFPVEDSRKKCEICGHPEVLHRKIKDDTGEHLYCDKCRSVCF